jgi:hypothetical protein
VDLTPESILKKMEHDFFFSFGDDSSPHPKRKCLGKVLNGLPYRKKALPNSDVCGQQIHWHVSNISPPTVP